MYPLMLQILMAGNRLIKLPSYKYLIFLMKKQDSDGRCYSLERRMMKHSIIPSSWNLMAFGRLSFKSFGDWWVLFFFPFYPFMNYIYENINLFLSHHVLWEQIICSLVSQVHRWRGILPENLTHTWSRWWDFTLWVCPEIVWEFWDWRVRWMYFARGGDMNL